GVQEEAEAVGFEEAGIARTAAGEHRELQGHPNVLITGTGETPRMADLKQYNPTGRFSGLEDRYAKYRPDYPAAVLDYIMAQCGLSDKASLVDVGCGTGISSRLFAARGLRVVGVEPNEAMRARAEAEPAPPGVPTPTYRGGR